MFDNFYEDVFSGKYGETLISNALTAKGFKVDDRSNDWTYRRNDIDFIIIDRNGQEKTLEVKTDYASEYTNNVFIELENNNNKSHNYKGWLRYSLADYICFIQPNKKEAFIVSLEELKQRIKYGKYKRARGKDAYGVLLPITALITYSSCYCMEV